MQNKATNKSCLPCQTPECSHAVAVRINAVYAIVNASTLTLLGAQYVKAKLCVLHRAMNMYERNGGWIHTLLTSELDNGG